MTDRLYLDPYAVAKFEPHEGPPSNQEFISPFSVPEGLEYVKNPSGEVSRITFRYPGGEAEDMAASIDERTDPAVQARIAQRTGKVIVLTFDPPADAGGLKRVADRLEQQAKHRPTKSRKFSDLMISSVLREWADKIAGPVA